MSEAKAELESGGKRFSRFSVVGRPTVASTVGFFIMRYVVFSRRRWFDDRL